MEQRGAGAARRGGGDGRHWIYGVNPVLEVLRAGRKVRAVYIFAGRHRKVSDLTAEAQARGVPVKVVEDSSFFNTRFPKGHQGVAAEVRGERYVELEELLSIPSRKGEEPFFLVLDLIEDPRNLGAVLRSAEAAGVHGAVIQSHRAASLGPEALKASAGAAEHVPVASVPNIKLALDAMKEAGAEIVGAEAGGHPEPWGLDLSGALALVVGSEGSGLRRTVRERCDRLVSLPMRGRVNSLNTSVAAGILIYEVLRQRLQKGRF
ncbi:MAG: 23S rRNA (guanosine(2251)-2'-O)-methyltransferase RlmB [Thermodesulfovibrionales bacterium]